MIQGMNDLLKMVVDRGASDLHIKVGSAPGLRIHGELVPLDDIPPLSRDDTERLVSSMMTESHKGIFTENNDLDFAYNFSDLHRFRVNAYVQRDSIGAVLRVIPMDIPSIDSLGLPEVLKEISMKKRGLVLVTGPTGSGKSSTLAAMVDHINSNKRCNIVTMEDPIEFIHQDKMSYVIQRAVGKDTKTFDTAMAHVLRQDPDVILVGEMRDLKTMETAITAAETGHLVMATLHTNSAPETISRVIDAFPPHQQSQVQSQLSTSLEAVMCQSLIPKQGGGRVCAIEIMLKIPAVGHLIREGKTFQLSNVIQTNSGLGMQTMDQALRALVEQDLITFETAALYSANPEDFKRLTITRGRNN